ncbi:MAG: FAD-binding oxidoreductase [Paracoccaceae bacterium]
MLNPADAGFAEGLAGQLPPDTLRAPEPRHLTEPRGRYQGHGGLLALPRDAGQVATIVRACAAARVGIVPISGGTGLVGGQVMPDGPLPLILSTERMQTIRAVYPDENVLIADAGCILETVHQAADAVGRLFPLTIASQGSARVGGILSTNAGGVNVLRYGNARDLCLGVEAVLPDGQIWNGLTRLRKDNTGYDLRDLLIGAEGSLGIITAATLRLHPRPARQGAAFLVVQDPAAALQLLAMAQDMTGGGVSAFELIHGQGLLFLDEVLPDVRQPFAVRPEWMVLVDLGLPSAMDPVITLEALFVAAEAAGLASDGVIAASGAQRDAFWQLREAMPEANRRIGSISSHDISVPLGALADFVDEATAALRAMGDYRINAFGHVGDGNLHYNVFPAKGRDRAEYELQRGAIKTLVHDLVHRFGGSVSAEHGVGRLKVADLEHYGDRAKLSALRAIKLALDPAGIMNPGAVLRA